jgi:hypothetical protein
VMMKRLQAARKQMLCVHPEGRSCESKGGPLSSINNKLR